jgi:hypothetical protein
MGQGVYQRQMRRLRAGAAQAGGSPAPLTSQKSERWRAGAAGCENSLMKNPRASVVRAGFTFFNNETVNSLVVENVSTSCRPSAAHSACVT